MESNLKSGRKLRRQFSIALVLIFVDQLTKYWALVSAPPVRTIMRVSPPNIAIGFWLHAPDTLTTYTAIGAFLLGIMLWLLPISRFTRLIWTVAILSNHVEMLVRPGTVDFLVLRFHRNVCVANLADFYFLIGAIWLLWWLVRRIKGTNRALWRTSISPDH